MAGGLPIPANHAFHSIREEAPATFPERVRLYHAQNRQAQACSTTVNYCVNEVPQPQLRVACGFWNTKPRRIRSS